MLCMLYISLLISIHHGYVETCANNIDAEVNTAVGVIGPTTRMQTRRQTTDRQTIDIHKHTHTGKREH